jgi:transcriptional regulator with XRE-family HTH domain
MTTLGEKIKKLRQDKGYTLDKLAELADSSKSYIWELENKAPPRPSAEKLSKLAEQLGVTLDYLLDENAEITKEDATDKMFYRKYRDMKPETKEKIRKMVDLWDDE